MAPTLESLPAPVGLQTQMASESGKAPPRCPVAAGVAAALLLAAAAAGGQITQQQQSPAATVMQCQQESAFKALGGPAVLPTYKLQFIALHACMCVCIYIYTNLHIPTDTFMYICIFK